MNYSSTVVSKPGKRFILVSTDCLTSNANKEKAVWEIEMKPGLCRKTLSQNKKQKTKTKKKK